MTVILAIESSCDDTAVAIIDDQKNILANKVVTQLAEHAPYAGVVPEIAARAHMHYLKQLINEALAEAQLKINQIDAFAATGGPGLIGGVIVGTMFAKALASVNQKPFLAINHLEGHALTARLCSDLQYPYLLLLISGGHCQFITIKNIADYTILGHTLDDAIGEAFDKVAKMLNVGYPGGPLVEQFAKNGNELAYALPLAMVGRNGCDMSFSGIKTAVKQIIDKIDKPLTAQNISDICASFQYTVTKIICSRLQQAIKIYQQTNRQLNFVIAGGVAANLYIRQQMNEVLIKHGFNLYAPPLKLCTDNAAMIAWAAMERYQQQQFDDLTFCPKARWSLEELKLSVL